MAKGITVIEQAPASEIKKSFLLALFCIAQFIDAFNINALYSAIPIMREELHLSRSESVWLVSAYQLTFAAFLLCSGRISDVCNPKSCFVVGAMALGVFSILVGVMPDKIALLVMRALSGIAAALTIPSSLRLLVSLFPEQREQARALGVFGACATLGNVLGIIIGAIFVQYANWHWIFHTAGIIAIMVGLVCVVVVPKQHAPADPSKHWLTHLDLPGIGIITTAMILVIFALTSSGTEGWTSATVLAPLILGLLLIAGFFVWEAYTDERDAAFPPKTWRIANLFLIKVQLWQDVYHWSPIKSAIHLLPVGLVAGPTAIIAEPLCNRFENKWTLLLAQTLLVISTVFFPFADENSARSYWRLDFPAMVIGAAGGALLYVNVNVAVFHHTPAEISGTVGAIINSALQLGSAVGVAVVSSIVSDVGASHPDDSYAGRAAAFWFLFALMVVCAVAIVLFYRTDEQLRDREDAMGLREGASIKDVRQAEGVDLECSDCIPRCYPALERARDTAQGTNV